LARLATAIGAEPPAEFDALSEADRQALADLVETAARERSELIDRAIDDSLRHIPGPVETDLWLGDHGVAAQVGQASGSEPADVVRTQRAHAATGRFTYPQEVADLAVLLASDRAGNVTGSDFLIDGGLIKTL
jgi:hypothetical protein